MDSCMWVAAGYPALLAAIGALWRAGKRKDRDHQALTQQLLAEKERHIQELEEFKKIVMERRGR